MLNLAPVLCFVFMAVPVPDEADAALSTFKRDIRSPREAERALAVATLAKTQHIRTLKVLAGFLMRDTATVRIEAARGLGLFTESKKKLFPVLVGAMRANKKEPAVRAEIIRTLGKLGEPRSLRTIHEAFKDKDDEVVVAAAAVAMKKKESLKLMLDVALDLEKQMAKMGNVTEGPKWKQRAASHAKLKKRRDAFISAFQAITKEQWTTAKELEVWWRRRGKDFKIEE